MKEMTPLTTMKPHRPRSNRTNNTIHGRAESGDLAGFRALLVDNPALLNECSPILSQTPLHVAAGDNGVEIVQFLLDWRGPGELELEAKNVYGETPLHMAAKQGCGDTTRLLLSHGASVEAKTNNGMTPLHLACWHANLWETNSAVVALLEYNADCSAKDNDDRCPVDHLSQGPGIAELRELLHRHVEEQRRRRAIEACSEANAKMDELENELSNIVGLNDIKLQLRIWAKGMLLDERRRALGLKVGARRPPHMAFLGNPGTGKTMVARVLGKLLHMVGILPTNKVTEVQRTDLVGEFIGHTGPKTRRMIKEAEGGILFVDEAYRLVPSQKSNDKDYGLEALEEIMSVMDSGKIVVIFAGYSEPMKRVITSNEGFCRRVTKFFHFSDFTPEDLAKITHLKIRSQPEGSLLHGFMLHASCTVDAIASLIERETTVEQRREMNGGMIEPMLVNARENLDLRLSFDCIDTDELLTITVEDLEAGIRLLSK
ncbi:hypothetical protein Droror1_Dr00007397 [Drosera rotundifolia]